ncbi:hypothetical protein A5634_19080 [Mycobacterium asiaticum]|uniref:PknH-like extracellular domain-containing protein n=1 Tax=Mycobacterium asiaticum TaxID=1790 RepID=A0A1A3P4B6_MYCAS|nr:hypothetical protein A5634_19080 [Mycobacterium asiaticum]
MPAWNQGPHPAPKRNPWPIVAAVAVVLVLVVGGIIVWAVIPDKKDVKKKKLISEERLSSLLLSSSEINSVMGSSTMQPGKPITSVDSSPASLSLMDCQGTMYTSQAPTYSGTGYTGISSLVSSEPGDDYDHWANQAAVTFPTTDKADEFLQTQVGKWKNCAGKQITVTSKSKTFRWTLGELQGQSPKITLSMTQEGANGWECQRAMGVTNNVVVDVKACGFQITNQGAQIVDKIVAKADEET